VEKVIKIDDKDYTVVSDDNYLVAMGDNYEPHMVQLFRALVNPDDVVADIGANIGLTAILFSTLSSKVLAFEPSPSTYSILKVNLARASVDNVETINCGFGEKKESLTITFASNNRSGGYVSDKIRPESGHITEKIQIDTLDNYFRGSEIIPTFLKIDVEGFEKNVIKGGAEFLQKHKPSVVMEMNHFCLDVLQRITIPDFLDFMLAEFPYLYAIDTDNETIVDLRDQDRAYFVMHEHVVQNRFPNLVAAFDPSIKQKLDMLAAASSFHTPMVTMPDGAILANSIPMTLTVGETHEIQVTLSNSGNEAWYGYGANPVLLCYHWRNNDGNYDVYDGVRTKLRSQVVRPGESVHQMLRVVSPSKPGNFNLVLTVVQEGNCWFEDKGFKYAVGNVAVV